METHNLTPKSTLRGPLIATMIAIVIAWVLAAIFRLAFGPSFQLYVGIGGTAVALVWLALMALGDEADDDRRSPW